MTNDTPEARDGAQAAEPLALRLNDLLGPLPEPDVMWEDGKDQWGYADYSHAYSAAAMQAYGQAAAKAAIEACVEVLDEARMTAELCQAACDSETGGAYYNNDALQAVALCLGECIDRIDGPNAKLKGGST